jgi:transposase InsO family protein
LGVIVVNRRMSRHLVIDALRMAIGRRQPAEGLVHHSDRGAQYTSEDFLAELTRNGIKTSHLNVWTPPLSACGLANIQKSAIRYISNIIMVLGLIPKSC